MPWRGHMNRSIRRGRLQIAVLALATLAIPTAIFGQTAGGYRWLEVDSGQAELVNSDTIARDRDQAEADIVIISGTQNNVITSRYQINCSKMRFKATNISTMTKEMTNLQKYNDTDWQVLPPGGFLARAVCLRQFSDVAPTPAYTVAEAIQAYEHALRTEK